MESSIDDYLWMLQLPVATGIAVIAYTDLPDWWGLAATVGTGAACRGWVGFRNLRRKVFDRRRRAEFEQWALDNAGLIAQYPGRSARDVSQLLDTGISPALYARIANSSRVAVHVREFGPTIFWLQEIRERLGCDAEEAWLWFGTWNPTGAPIPPADLFESDISRAQEWRHAYGNMACWYAAAGMSEAEAAAAHKTGDDEAVKMLVALLG